MKKHDCDKMQKQFTDWLFADSSAALEFDECQLCHEQYLTLKNSLGQFDQAFSVMMPEENYWSDYEAKLWTKLAAENQTATKKINLWQPRWIVPVAAGVALILLAVLNLSAVKKPEEKISAQVATAKPEPIFEPEKIADSSKSNSRKRRFEKPNKPERKDPARSLNKKPQLLFDLSQHWEHHKQFAKFLLFLHLLYKAKVYQHSDV